MERAVDAPDVGTPIPDASSSIFYGTESEWWDQVRASMRQRHAQQLRPLHELDGDSGSGTAKEKNDSRDDDDDDFSDDVDTSDDEVVGQNENGATEEGDDDDDQNGDVDEHDVSSHTHTGGGSDSCDSSAEESGNAGDKSCDDSGSDAETDEEVESGSGGDTDSGDEEGSGNGSSSPKDIPIPAWRRRIPRRQRAGSGASDGFPFPSQRTDGKGSDGRSPRPPKVRGRTSHPQSGKLPGRRTHSASGAGPDSPAHSSSSQRRPRRFKWQKVLTHEQGLEGSVWSPAPGSVTSSDSSGSADRHRRANEADPSAERKRTFSAQSRQRGESAVEDVLILVGGVNGGVEGPAGLYHHLHSLARLAGSKPPSRDGNRSDDRGAEITGGGPKRPIDRDATFNDGGGGSVDPAVAPLAGWSILSLNTRHCLDDAIPVRTFSQWPSSD